MDANALAFVAISLDIQSALYLRILDAPACGPFLKRQGYADFISRTVTFALASESQSQIRSPACIPEGLRTLLKDSQSPHPLELGGMYIKQDDELCAEQNSLGRLV